MQARVQKIGNSYAVMLPTQVVEDLHLLDGSYVDIHRVATSSGVPALEIQRLSDDEAISLFEKLEPFHRNTFAELAK